MDTAKSFYFYRCFSGSDVKRSWSTTYFFLNLMNFFRQSRCRIHKWITRIEWDSFIFLLRVIINGSRSEFGEYRTIESPPPALVWLENVFHFFLNMKGVTSNDFGNWGNNKLMNLIQYHFDYHWGFGIRVYDLSNDHCFCLLSYFLNYVGVYLNDH